MLLTLAVEGRVDELVGRRLIRDAKHKVGPVHGLKGKDYLDSRLTGYNNAARLSPWLVLRDLDHDASCAPELCTRLLPAASARLRLQIVVRTVESWLIADDQSLSRFLGVQSRLVPDRPEALHQPKVELIKLARHSRKRAIRDALVPSSHSGVAVGPGYSVALAEFVNTMWQPVAAASRSESLARLLRYLNSLPREP